MPRHQGKIHREDGEEREEREERFHHKGTKARREGQGQRIILNVEF